MQHSWSLGGGLPTIYQGFSWVNTDGSKMVTALSMAQATARRTGPCGSSIPIEDLARVAGSAGYLHPGGASHPSPILRPLAGSDLPSPRRCTIVAVCSYL